MNEFKYAIKGTVMPPEVSSGRRVKQSFLSLLPGFTDYATDVPSEQQIGYAMRRECEASRQRVQDLSNQLAI